MRIVRPLLRKATKTVVYPLVPAVPIAKTLAVGTRHGNEARKAAREQNDLLREQNDLLARQAPSGHVGVDTVPAAHSTAALANDWSQYHRQPPAVRAAAEQAGWKWVPTRGWVWPRRRWPRSTPAAPDTRPPVFP